MPSREELEFKIAVRDIAQYAALTLNPYDRVRVCEWIRKIASIRCDNPDLANRKNNYAQLLRIMVKYGTIHAPFQNLPPEGRLPPFSEILNKCLRDRVPGLAQAGPIAPVVNHKCGSGQVYLSTKRIPEGGVFCYMACSPQPFV